VGENPGILNKPVPARRTDGEAGRESPEQEGHDIHPRPDSLVAQPRPKPINHRRIKMNSNPNPVRITKSVDIEKACAGQLNLRGKPCLVIPTLTVGENLRTKPSEETTEQCRRKRAVPGQRVPDDPTQRTPCLREANFENRAAAAKSSRRDVSLKMY
jgi:hypothetical protein